MHPLTKRIVLLVSIFCVALGLFLLAYNLHLMPETTIRVVLQLWPVVLIVAGILLIADSLKKRRFTRSSLIEKKEFPLPLVSDAGELLCKVHFSYGTLNLGASQNGPLLLTERIGPMSDPAILRETRGSTSVLTVTMTQPLFPSYFQLVNNWHLNLPRVLSTRLELHLHEANLLMDLRPLSVESIEMRAGSGKQRILIGKLRKKLVGQIYSSSSELSIVLPFRAYVQVRLLNPFCRVDYPQGDFERREDGSFVSAMLKDPPCSVEITIDGPIKNLTLDVEDADNA